METKFHIVKESAELIDRQLRLIKRGWYLYAPLAIVVFALAFVIRYDPRQMLLSIATALFTMGTIFLFTFIINPLRRIRIINHIIRSVEFVGANVHITTYSAFWKQEQIFILKINSFRMIDGASEKSAELFGQPCLRLRSEDSKRDLYLLHSFFSNSTEVKKQLHNLLSQ